MSKATSDAYAKASKNDGASSFKSGANGDVKIVSQRNERDKDTGKWVSYALCSIN